MNDDHHHTGDENRVRIGAGANADQVVSGSNNTQRQIEAQEYIEKFVLQTKPPVRDARFSIPPPPPKFTGRKQDAQRVLTALKQPGGAVIGAVAGLGGVGKTALACYVAEQTADIFPDGMIFVEMGGTGDAPLKRIDVMGQVIRAFEGADLKLPDHVSEVAALYQSVLHGKRALILLDNARDSSQVQGLYPPAGNGLLVTSRAIFQIEGVAPVHLNKMDLSDAKDLLLKLCERIGDRAQEIAELCGELPLALRIAAGYLAERENVNVERYAARLRERPLKELDEVHNVFTVTFDNLSKDQQKWWRMLGVFPATFDEAAAACLWGFKDSGNAERVLGELTRFSLVEFQDMRYELHDLLRDFAIEKMKGKGGGKERAARLHARYFERVANTADDLYIKGGKDVLKGLGLFDMEIPNIRSGHLWAVETSDRDEEAAKLVMAYANSAPNVLDLRLSPIERLEWVQKALTFARRAGNRSAELNNLLRMGNAFLDLGETQNAMGSFEQALAIGREIGHRRLESRALSYIGNVNGRLGEWQKAIEHYEQALAIAIEIGSRRYEGSNLGSLGYAYFRLDMVEKAIEYLEQALTIALEFGDRINEGNFLNNLGEAHYKVKAKEKAMRLYEEALLIARETKFKELEGTIMKNLAKAYREDEDKQNASDALRNALNVFGYLGVPQVKEAQVMLAELNKEME